MKSFAMTVNLKDDPEIIRKYIDHHGNPYPEVVDALKKVGIEEIRIWILGRRLFMLLDTQDDFDPEIDFPKYLTLDPRCVEWEDLMTTFQEPVEEAKPEEKWASMTEIFTLSKL